MPTEAGYSNTKKQGQTAHKTLHKLGSSVVGAHVVPKSLVERQAVAAPIVSVALSSDTKSIRVEVTGHGALVGDIARFYTGTIQGAELEIISVIDANFFVIRNVVGVPAIADTLKVMYYVTPKADQEGNVNFSPGPTTFVQDTVTVTVTEDTANPANNKGLPVIPTFYKDGVPVTVNIDSVTPANNRPLPVELAGVSGPVTINAGDLSVSITATNDSVALGDGVTGDLANVRQNATTLLNELKVADDAAIALLTTIDTDIAVIRSTITSPLNPPPAEGVTVMGSDGISALFLKTDSTGRLETVPTAAILPTGAATLAEQQTQSTSLGQIAADTLVQRSTVNTDGNPAGTTGTMIGGKDSLGDFQQVAVNAAGELSVTFGTAAFATEATLSALNNKVANDYGSSVGAVRTAAQLGNATGAADFGVGADGAQTLRVSANLKRSGNELDYNSGAASANTVRTVLATRHEDATTPLAARLSGGTGFITDTAVNGNNQLTIGTNGRSLKAAAFMMGFDGFQHRQVALNSFGEITAGREQILNENSVTTTGSVTAPVGTRGFIIQNSTRAQGALRFAAGVASPTNGYLLEPGQSTSYIRGNLGVMSLAEVDGLPFDAFIIWFG